MWAEVTTVTRRIKGTIMYLALAPSVEAGGRHTPRVTHI